MDMNMDSDMLLVILSSTSPWGFGDTLVMMTALMFALGIVSIVLSALTVMTLSAFANLQWIALITSVAGLHLHMISSGGSSRPRRR
jgi:hypothetical protein